jgi:protein-S-isoprenylcysteine O-methyltransferase Ste14
VHAQQRSMVFNLGDFFFRWRSYLPLLLVPILCVAISRTQYRFASHSADVMWEMSTWTLAVAGLALRAWTVGVAAPGTSGRNTRRQKATTLNTTGPYSMVRHPLYVANWLIVLALALFPHTWLAPPVVASVAAGYYACIAKREEAFLRQEFGLRFEEWAARVPGFIPRVSLYCPAQRAFDFKVVVRREFYGLAVILVTPLAIEMAEHFAEHRTFALDPIWAPTALVGAATFIVGRVLKKHGRSRGNDAG